MNLVHPFDTVQVTSSLVAQEFRGVTNHGDTETIRIKSSVTACLRGSNPVQFHLSPLGTQILGLAVERIRRIQVTLQMAYTQYRKFFGVTFGI